MVDRGRYRWSVIDSGMETKKAGVCDRTRGGTGGREDLGVTGVSVIVPWNV